MRRWKQVAVAVSTLGFIGTGVLCLRSFTFAWDRAWVEGATALTLTSPNQNLSGAQLTSFLGQFEVNTAAELDYRCTLFERRGTIVVNGHTYPIRLVDDKFTGESLVVEGRWKTIEFFQQAPRAGASLRTSAGPRRE